MSLACAEAAEPKKALRNDTVVLLALPDEVCVCSQAAGESVPTQSHRICRGARKILCGLLVLPSKLKLLWRMPPVHPPLSCVDNLWAGPL
eukprot:scaffold56930_cov49-Phaeocystis_antarctica.AAC.3